MGIYRLLLDGPNHVHPLDDLTENCKALAVEVTMASKVQRRLIPDADEK